MTPQEMRALAVRAREDTDAGSDWYRVGEDWEYWSLFTDPADAEHIPAYIAAHDPALLILLWDVVDAAEHGPESAIATALNAVYRRIGYTP